MNLFYNNYRTTTSQIWYIVQFLAQMSTPKVLFWGLLNSLGWNHASTLPQGKMRSTSSISRNIVGKCFSIEGIHCIHLEEINTFFVPLQVLLLYREGICRWTDCFHWAWLCIYSHCGTWASSCPGFSSRAVQIRQRWPCLNYLGKHQKRFSCCTAVRLLSC